MPQNNSNSPNTNLPNKTVKVAGYAQRVFFNNNIEYRNFSPDIVGFGIDDGGTTVFTNGNFTITTNLEPKPNVIFQQGSKSKYFTLNDIKDDVDETKILENLKTKLNLDLTNPLSYIWYGSTSELIKSSLEDIFKKWPAAIYVNNTFGDTIGNNITNYVYNPIKDESTFKISTNYFSNPYNIKFSLSNEITGTEKEVNPLRNFSIEYKSYIIENGNIKRKILNIIPPKLSTNDILTLTVEGNPFPQLTGILIPQYSILNTPQNGSIPFFIKPNETKISTFFSSLNSLQSTLLNRNNYPIYNTILISPKISDQGVLITTKENLIFPLLEDGYNLNFFDSYYLEYIDKLNNIGTDYDKTSTDLIVRKYTAEVINSFDTVPRGDGNDLVLNGEKATKLLRIYGVSFDDVKKYINGIKFAHVVTYNKKNNIPDTLVKELSHMLGLDPITFVSTNKLNETILPVIGQGEFSGTTKSLSNSEVDIELYRRLILNLAWLWKSKGSRKAVEFLFRFIGAPEALVKFDEYIVIVDKPLDMEKLKDLLYLYTGDVDTNFIPYDDNGFPNPPKNGSLVPISFDNLTGATTGSTVESTFKEMWFQKAGGWYRETLGNNTQTILNGNNPHVGKYDGGNEYLDYFQQCYVPNFSSSTSVNLIETINKINHFTNYNYGIFNGIPSGTTQFFTNEMAYNSNSGVYENVDDCYDINYSLINSPLPNEGVYPLEQNYIRLENDYNVFLNDIREKPYLRYSSEFIILKNEYLNAKKLYETQINTANCENNQALEICLSTIEVEENKVVIEDCCDELTIKYNEPYFSITETSNGKQIKVSGQKLKCCCEKQEINGEQARYINYTLPNNDAIIEYCAVMSPCNSEVAGIREDGKVEFISTSSNNQPTYQLKDGNYYVFNSSPDIYPQFCENDMETVINTMFPNSNGTTGNRDNDIRIYGDYLIDNNSTEILNGCFTQTNNNNTTIYSSPECCAWHGYSSEIIEVTEGDLTNFYTVCVNQVSRRSNVIHTSRMSTINTEIEKNKNSISNLDRDLKSNNITSKQRETLFSEKVQKQQTIKDLETEKGTIIKEQSLNTKPNVEVSYNNYEPYTNRNATVDNLQSTNSNKKLFDDVSVTKTLPNEKDGNVELYSTFEDSDLNDTKNWEVESIDSLGRVSFSAKDRNNNKHILDWNSNKGEGNELYANLGRENGYVYDAFEIDYSKNRLRTYNFATPTTPIETKNRTTIAVVDTNRISCDDINSVDVLFGSENYMGFNLPTDTNCDCDINISLDYMLKYNAQSLNRCLGGICDVGIINKINTDTLKCKNFLVFTNNEEESIKLENNIGKGNQLEEIEIWNNTIQIEPNSECCKSLGGEIINSEQSFWSEIHNQWTIEINNKIDEIRIANDNGDIASGVNNDIQRSVNDVDIVSAQWSELKNNISNCVNISYPTINFDCLVNVNDYVYTNQICALKLPDDCGIYSYLSQELITVNTEIDYAIIELEKCLEAQSNRTIIINEIETEIINDETRRSQIQNTNQEEQTKLDEEIKTIESRISIEDNKLNSKEEENKTIDQAINGINPIQDCNLYQQKINDINSIDVNQFCINSRNKEECIKTKTESINSELKTYNDLLKLCERNNALNNDLDIAKEQNNKEQIDYLIKEINNNNVDINSILEDPNGVKENNINLQTSEIEDSNKISVINKTAELLNTDTNSITNDKGDLNLTDKQKIDLKIQKSNNISEINKITNKRNELEVIKKTQLDSKTQIEEESLREIEIVNEDIIVKRNVRQNMYSSTSQSGNNCCSSNLEQLIKYKQSVLSFTESIENEKENVYNIWDKSLNENKNNINYQNGNTYIDYMDDLKVNFNLFVKQNTGKTTKLPYTNSINPVWEWKDPSTVDYSGIIIGDDYNGLVEQDIIYTLNQNGITPSNTLFDPEWQNINFSLPNCVCETLKTTYPNGEFYFSLEIVNIECDVCIIVDNIEVNISDCNTQKELTLTNCMIPELTCVIDNKKSWVYNTGGIEYETIYPNGDCNTGSTNNYNITKLIKPEDRLWQELEYRYTEYTNPHSDLIINTKSTVFAIDPANAIECDVYNFWKNIECEDCPTSCDLTCFILGDDGNYLITEDNCKLLIWCNVESDIIDYNGVVRDTPTDPLSGYTLTLTGCCGETFNCDTYVDLLEEKVSEMKNEYYLMTGDYSNSVNSSYYDFKDKGGNLDNFGITKNNCGSDTIVLGNFKDKNELFGLLVEDIDGSLAMFEVYTFDGVTPYISGATNEILPGYSAQTFNQTEYLDKECCLRLSKLLTSKSSEGFGLDKDYKWSEEYSACTWTDIDEGEGDCTYCGTKEVIDRRACLPRCPEGYEYDEINNNCQQTIIEYRRSENHEPCPVDYEYINEENEEFCRKTEIICPIDYEIVGEEGSQYCEKIEVEDAIEEIPDPTVDCGITDETPSGGNDGTFTFYRNLGTDMGEVVFEFNAAGVPDRFIVEWDGQVVIDTGYVGQTNFTMANWTGKTYDGSVYSGETYLDGLVLPAYSPQPSPNITYTTQGYDGPAGSQGTQQDIDVISLNGVFNLQGGAHPFYNDASLVQRYNSVNGTNLTVNDLSGTNRGLDLGPLSGETGWSPTVFYYGVGDPNHPYSHGAHGTGTAAFIKDKKIGQKYIDNNITGGTQEFDVKITVLSANVVGGPDGTGWKFKLRCVKEVVGITEVATVPGFYCEDDTFTLVEEDGVAICKKSITANTENEVTVIESTPAPIVEHKTTLFKEALDIEKYTATTDTVCINPKDYLDINPKQINVKETFDDLILSNLIDAKSRQVISNYPMLKLFYQLYLTSKDCGKEFSGKLTYNDLFNFMDKIGDYWLDLLEQIVPATTIWEGCDNSGKLYRNTIFDQNKHQYRRYVLNYNDSTECPLTGISENIIASSESDVTLIEYSLQPSNNVINIKEKELSTLILNKENLLNQIQIIENQLCAIRLQDSSEEQSIEIQTLEKKLSSLTNYLNQINNEIDNLKDIIQKMQQQLSDQESEFQNSIIESCNSIGDLLTKAEKDLYDLYTPYTTSYERQKNYIAGLRNNYKNCIRKSQTQISKYDTIFITQIYDSNEYEGNVTVIGDAEWEEGGPFFNNSLIYNCDEIITVENDTRA